MLKWALPGAVWLSIALLPILFFYFLRIRFRAQPVSSIYIWSRLQSVTTGGSKLRRRSLLLLFLQIVTALAAVGSVAQPFLSTRHLAPPGVMFLVDISASMNTIENSPEGAQTRIELARQLLTGEIKNLKPKTNCMIFLCDTEAKPLGKPNSDYNRILLSLNQIKAGSGGFDETEVANQLQTWLETQNRPWKACIISDGGLDLGGRKLAGVFGGSLRTIILGKERRNLGITGLRLLDRKAQFAVYNSWHQEQVVQVSLSYENQILAKASLRLPPGLSIQTAGFQGPVKPGVYKIQIEKNHDALKLDDCTYFAVNPPRRFRVLQVGPDNPFLRALLSHPSIELTAIPSFPDEPQDGWDLVIADRVAIPRDLKANLLSFERTPPGAPVRIGKRIGGVFTGTNLSHPLLRFVKWESIQISNGRSLEVKPGVQILAEAAGVPVIGAWKEKGFHKVVCGFNLYTSDLGLSGAFPVFFQNLLQWCVPQGANQLSYNLTVGEPALLAEPATWHITNDSNLKTSRQGSLIQIKALKPGIFRWKTESEQGFLAANLPLSESDITSQPLHLKPNPEKVAAELATVQTPLEQWLLFLLLICLALEWIIWRGGWQAGKE